MVLHLTAVPLRSIAAGELYRSQRQATEKQEQLNPVDGRQPPLIFDVRIGIGKTMQLPH
jgi:hypothetical protein